MDEASVVAVRNAITQANDSYQHILTLVTQASTNWPKIENHLVGNQYTPQNRFEWFTDYVANRLSTLSMFLEEPEMASEECSRFLKTYQTRGLKEFELLREYIHDPKNDLHISMDEGAKA
ncbi:MAG: hypothetical protein ACOYJ2_05640 [Rickettsiales bacterium]